MDLSRPRTGGKAICSRASWATAAPYLPLRIASQEAGPTDNLRLQIGDRVYHVGTLAVRQSRMAYRSLSVMRDEGNDLLVLFLTALSLFASDANTTFSVNPQPRQG